MNDKAELVEVDEKPIVALATNPMQAAIQSGASPPELLQFMELQERWEANEARKAYVVAMNQFKADPPEIFKDKTVSYDTSSGTTTYQHAKLSTVANTISEAMAKHELSFRWDTEQLDGGMIRVTCVVTHALGHSERTPLQSGADQSGGKNNIQAIGSTVSYLERYTLLAAAGIATSDMDDDGVKSEQVERISEDQALTIHSMIVENELDMDRFMTMLSSELKVDSIDDINVNAYSHVVSKIQATIRAAQT